MNNSSTITIKVLPQDGLRKLEKAVAQRFDWRLRTGGSPEQPRFVIEKRVRYSLMRGYPLDVLYQVNGKFQRTMGEGTTLHYAVSGQPGSAFIQAAFYIAILVAIGFLLQVALSDPMFSANWISTPLALVLYIAAAVYAWFTYRRYQTQMRELEQFMQEFIQTITV